MLLPLVLDQAAARHELQHVVYGSRRHRARVRAGYRRLATASLRPKAVKDESIVSANSALAGMVAGMARAIVRRPGECKQVVIELASSFGVGVVTVVLGKGEGSEGEKQAQESWCNKTLHKHCPGSEIGFTSASSGGAKERRQPFDVSFAPSGLTAFHAICPTARAVGRILAPLRGCVPGGRHLGGSYQGATLPAFADG
jgi:hypothetical protein